MLYILFITAATTLATSRTIQTNLASTSSASFNGSANITPGVTGTLGLANGGTGGTTAYNGYFANKIAQYASTLDPDTTTSTSILTASSNRPVDGASFSFINTYFYANANEDGTANRYQISHGYTTNRMFTRYRASSVWSDWVEIYSSAKSPSTDYTATVTTTWSGASTTYYYQYITVTGILSTDTPIVDINLSDAGFYISTNNTYLDEYSKIYRIKVSSDNTICVFASEKTTLSITLTLKCIR